MISSWQVLPIIGGDVERCTMKTPNTNEIARTRGPGAPNETFDDAVAKANGSVGEGPLEAAKMDAGSSSDWWRTKLIKASDLYDQQFPKL